MQAYLIEFKSSYKCLASKKFFERLNYVGADRSFKSVKLIKNVEIFIKNNPSVDAFL